MAELSKAEEYLIDRIAEGDSDGWCELVDRYQGRLLAFANSRLSQASDAEDIVQETFLAFIKSLPNFRKQSSVETYLFSILRRKIVDVYRGRKVNPTLIQDTLSTESGEQSSDGFSHIPGSDPSASTYARRGEQDERQREQLAIALTELLADTRKKQKFRDLQIAELIFYGQLRNKQIADLMEMNEKQVALIKHRMLKRIGLSIEATARGHDSAVCSDALLTQVWENVRPSCPKRSTIGKYALKTLDKEWQKYVDFHLNALGCRFCRANYEDIEKQTASDEAVAFRDRVLQSTVGFLSKGK